MENAAIKKMKKDPKYFYNYAKKASKSPNQVGPFINEDGTIIKESVEKAEMLRAQYESVYSKPDEEWKVNDPDSFFNIQEDMPAGDQECDNCLQEIPHECVEDSGTQLSSLPSSASEPVPAVTQPVPAVSQPVPAVSQLSSYSHVTRAERLDWDWQQPGVDNTQWQETGTGTDNTDQRIISQTCQICLTSLTKAQWV